MQEVVADNTVLVQNLLDRHCHLANGGAPLVLLEMPSLTYFVAGTLPIATFSRVVTEKVPSGFVLDVGHLWTVFLYAGAWRTTSLVQFIDAFLRVFPLERVVEIHVAGLAMHESSMAVHAKLAATRGDNPLPARTDAYAAPIPSVLFEMLDQILSHSRLTSLKGLALEVNTKPVELIVGEFARFSQRYATIFSLVKAGTRVSDGRVDKPVQREPVSASIRHALGEAYDQYARVVTGRAKPEGPEWNQRPACTEELETYPVRVPSVRDSPLGGEVEPCSQSCAVNSLKRMCLFEDLSRSGSANRDR